jgi:phenylalanyl-tRNA synthetase alpha chain
MNKKTNYSNIPKSIEAKIGRNLHNQLNHPLEIIKKYIYKYFDSLEGYNFTKFDNLEPYVTVEDNFDKLLIPKDHPARSKSDTYYINEKLVLRTQTSAHQNDHLTEGIDSFLVTGDVYRKDEIDRSHYPIFHQMEGVIKVYDEVEPKYELLRILSGLVEHLFPGCEYRINGDYFPFTDPSFEYEVKYNDKWLEILGCGVTQQEIVKNCGRQGQFIAFGLGIERLAMILFNVPDIRYFWSTDDKFLNQFKDGIITKFSPYSKLPNLTKDISFYIPSNKIQVGVVSSETESLCSKEEDNKLINKWIDENDFFEQVREVCGEWAEEVKMMDEYHNPKKETWSRMYRVTYSPYDSTLKDPSKFTKLCNNNQDDLRKKINKSSLDIVLR